MNKYILYRSLGRIPEEFDKHFETVEDDTEKHELVAVEYGEDIYEVEDALLNAAKDDMSGLEQYRGFVCEAEAPKAIDHARYGYSVLAIASPVSGLNILLEYGVTEEVVEKEGV